MTDSVLTHLHTRVPDAIYVQQADNTLVSLWLNPHSREFWVESGITTIRECKWSVFLCVLVSGCLHRNLFCIGHIWKPSNMRKLIFFLFPEYEYFYVSVCIVFWVLICMYVGRTDGIMLRDPLWGETSPTKLVYAHTHTFAKMHH